MVISNETSKYRCGETQIDAGQFSDIVQSHIYQGSLGFFMASACISPDISAKVPPLRSAVHTNLCRRRSGGAPPDSVVM